jgi:hypothetical protein
MRTFISGSVSGAVLAAVLATTSASRALADTPPADGTSPPPQSISTAPAPYTPARVPITPGSGPGLKGISVWGILPWGGVGVGARFAIPLGIPPLLSATSIRDSFAIEFGADLLHWSYDFGAPGDNFNYSWTEVLPVAGVMWDLWFNHNFAVYPKVELGWAFGWFSGWNGVAGDAQPTYGGFFIDGDVGALYKLGGGLTLRAEAGSDGLKLGAGWLF